MAKEEKQVVVVSNDSGPYWSINNYGRCTWKHKWWVLGCTAGIALAAFLVVRFAINPSKTVGTSKYSYNLATEVDATGTQRYLSGEIFNFTDAISQDNLQAVKDSKEEYANINVEKIIKDNGISVVQNEITEKNAAEGVTYTLTVKEKYFSSLEQMRNYVKDIIYSLQNKSNEAIKSYTVDKVITAKFSTLEFDQQVITLSTQYKNIETAYANLAKEFTSSARLEDGSLNEAITDFKEEYKDGSDTVFSKLSSRIYSEGLANITTNIGEKVVSLKTQAENYKTTLKTNLAQRTVYNNSLAELLSAKTIIDGAGTDISKRILEYEKNITDIDIANANLIESLRIYGYTDGNVNVTTLTISAVDSFKYEETQEYCQKGIIYQLAHAYDPAVKKTDCDNFGALLQVEANKLKADVEKVNEIHHYLYNTFNNKVNFYNSGIVDESGSVSSAIVAVVAAVVAFAASSLVVTAIEISKEREAKASK